MDAAAFDSLVRRLEPQAEADPAGYRRKVALWAAGGYAFIALLLAILLGLAGLIVYVALHHPGIWIKVLIPVVALAWVILRSLAVTYDPPEGRQLERGEAPKLFAMLDAVREDVAGPKVDRVLVDGSANASIVQMPRTAGLLGSTNYLTLGLPFLQALSTAELTAVVAHEMGHLSRRHGRFGTFVYGLRLRWAQLLNALEERRSVVTGIVRRFFEWYVPRFHARAFPLLRAHEFEADQAAAEATDPRTTARTLVAVTLVARWLDDRFWPDLMNRADREAAPPRTAFTDLGQTATARTQWPSGDWLKEALAREADTVDTHPSLKARLERLGVSADEALAAAAADPHETAATELLGGGPDLVGLADREWADSVGEYWAEVHRTAQEERKELDELEARGAASPAERLRLAELVARFRAREEAEPLYRAVLEEEPRNAVANFALGTALLERDDDRGLAHLQLAMDSDPDAVFPACATAIEYLSRRGRPQEAEPFRRRADAHAEQLERANDERSSVTASDRLLPHELDAEQVESLGRRLAAFPELTQAFVVRKQVELFPERPLYVIGLVPAGRFKDDPEHPLVHRVLERVEAPGDMLVIVAEGKVRKLLEQVSGARILER